MLQVYIGQTSHSAEIRNKEHYRPSSLAQPEKSAVPEHSNNEDHIIKFQKTDIITTKNRISGPPHQDAIELEFHYNNMHRNDGLILSKSWRQLIRVVRDRKRPFQTD
jgi:hypothetical protein